jgi:hypothetical protein
MYIKSLAKSAMLYLQHDFYNTIFKIAHKLYIASGSASPPPPRPAKEKFWVRTTPALAWRGYKNHEAPKSAYPKIQPRFKPRACRIGTPSTSRASLVYKEDTNLVFRFKVV